MKEMAKENIEVTVGVCDYNPSWDKLLITLKSIVLQKNVRLKIIIGDDGSVDNKFSDIEAYFSSIGFNDYKLLSNDTNQGTVKNLIRILKECETDYIKLISPGDALYGFNALQSMTNETIAHNAVVTVCDAIFYNEKGIQEGFQYPRMPQYLNKSSKKCLNHFLFSGDRISGATTFVNAKVFLNYLMLVESQIKYAEDSVYKLMIAKREKFLYYSNSCILYEYGSGISTSGNPKWRSIIDSEYAEINRIICDTISDIKIKNRFLTCCQFMNSPSIKNRIIMYVRNPNALFFSLKLRITGRRLSDTNKDNEFIKELGIQM